MLGDSYGPYEMAYQAKNDPGGAERLSNVLEAVLSDLLTKRGADHQAETSKRQPKPIDLEQVAAYSDGVKAAFGDLSKSKPKPKLPETNPKKFKTRARQL